jgi:hypothetical protein
VLLGNGDGSFGPHTDYGGHRGASCVAVGDLDGDGKVDLAVADQEADSVSVRLGNGDGTFRSRTACGVGIFPAFVVIQDLDGDGRRDLVVANYFSNSASVLRNVGATVSIRPPGAPSRFALSAPSPNPFHSSARFEIAMSEAAPVQFEIYDLTGRRIKVLEDGVLGAGRQTRFWDGFAADGTQAAVGVYLARFSAPGFERSTKVVVVR